MPLRWVRGENPYEVNHYGVLQVGAHANPRVITFRRKDLERKISGGGEHLVAGRPVAEADLAEAESRLLDPARRASEALMVHARPSADRGRLPELCKAVQRAATLDPASRPLPLTNPGALTPLVPPLRAADLPRPAWADLPVPGPDQSAEVQADVQFDL